MNIYSETDTIHLEDIMPDSHSICDDDFIITDKDIEHMSKGGVIVFIDGLDGNKISAQRTSTPMAIYELSNYMVDAVVTSILDENDTIVVTTLYS